MDETKKPISKKKKTWAARILSFYFVFFSALYFTGSDISPATTFSWRYILSAFCFVFAYLTLRYWRSRWQYFWMPVMFLALVDVALTMGATEAFFTTPGNVDFMTFLAFNQNPEPFYIIGFKSRALWFLTHAMAMFIWLVGKPGRIQKKLEEPYRHHRHGWINAHRGLTAGLASLAVFVVVFFSLRSQGNQRVGEAIEAQEEETTVSEAILNGKSCLKEVDDVWTCNYKIGNDLAFTISKNGLWTELIIKNKGTSDRSDYYLETESMPLQPIGLNTFRLDEGEGCLLIKAGKRNSSSEEIYSKGYISQELYNYNFIRFENDEVICYKYGEADKGSISCKWKD